jgi:hypothetical protein
LEVSVYQNIPQNAISSLLTEASYCREENILTMKVDELERYMRIIFDYPKQLKEE